MGKLLVICIAIAGVAANIAASQFVPASYYAFIEGDKTATMDFLRAMKPIPEFNVLLERQRNIFGAEIDFNLFDAETKREIQIFQLEKILEYNPKSRDVLYGLYKLYNEGDRTDKAQEYLNRAKAIDPLVESLQ